MWGQDAEGQSAWEGPVWGRIENIQDMSLGVLGFGPGPLMFGGPEGLFPETRGSILLSAVKIFICH